MQGELADYWHRAAVYEALYHNLHEWQCLYEKEQLVNLLPEADSAADDSVQDQGLADQLHSNVDMITARGTLLYVSLSVCVHCFALHGLHAHKHPLTHTQAPTHPHTHNARTQV